MKRQRSLALVVISAAISTLVGVAATAQQQQDPTWKWPESKVFETVNRVRAGRDLTPKRWLAARVAVGLHLISTMKLLR